MGAGVVVMLHVIEVKFMLAIIECVYYCTPHINMANFHAHISYCIWQVGKLSRLGYQISTHGKTFVLAYL